MNKKRIILIAVAAVIIVGGGVWLFGGAKAKHKVTYATATIHKGEISESVTATGTIEPVTEVEVGTQVSGIIDKIHVDYNSVVTKGQLIAEMDRVTLQSELASQRAAYNGAKAEYEYQKKLYERNKTLNEKQLIAATDYEQSVYNYEKAKSNYESSQASLAKAERNLSYATITSPHRRCGHQPRRGSRTDRGFRLRDTDTVHHRCRPDADAGCGRRGRSGHRRCGRGTARHVYRRCLPE